MTILPKSVCERLRESGVNLTHVPAGARKNGADFEARAAGPATSHVSAKPQTRRPPCALLWRRFFVL